MLKFVSLRNRLTVGAAVLALTMGVNANARADVAYAYAQQQISSLLVSTGTGGATISASGTLQTGSNTGASFASGVSATDATDALQSYLGPNPVPAQNLFAHVATFPGADPQAAGTAPTGMSTGASLTNFTRGDVAFGAVGDLFKTSVNVNNVAESYLNTGFVSASGTGGWTLNASFTVSAATALTVGYNFSNSLYTYTQGSGSTAQANYHLNVVIKDASGAAVFEANPTDTNHSFGSPPNNSNMFNTSGAGGVTTTGVTFAAGQIYTIVISGNENTFVRLAVPEPGPIALAAVAGGLACLAGIKRRFSRKTAA